MIGNINHYATWAEQTNLRDPSPWKLIKRYDDEGKHFSKYLNAELKGLHIHDPLIPGGVRKPNTNEMPKRRSIENDN